MDTQAILKDAQNYIAAESHPAFRQEVKDLIEKGSWDELNDRFYTELAFGTGGLRGLIGGGYNRINPYVVRRATQGLANYIKKHADSEAASAVVSFDSRQYSDLFALETALVLCANGIKTYLFTSLRPTPELSFAVRHFKATAGIMVTASHNPADYNGYKVYWTDGAQVIPPHDRGIITEAHNVRAEVSTMTRSEALEQELLVLVDAEVDDAYVDMAKRQALRPDLLLGKGDQVTVVYTPLHGTGGMMVERVLREMGVTVVTVPEQKDPDSMFPTVESPNPEEASAMEMAIALGRQVGADLVMGTDPDGDRIGIAIPDGKDMVLITGNQLGALLVEYILSTRKELGTLPDRPVFINTIVTSELQNLIADSYGVESLRVLTGFKYIAEKIRQFGAEKDGRSFVFGCEESYGYLVQTDVRDKDAVTAALLTTELVLYARSRGQTVLDQLAQIYAKHGYFREIQVSRKFEGQQGQRVMGELMETLRTNSPERLGGMSVELVRDYRDGTSKDRRTGQSRNDIDLPSSDVLQFVLEDASVVTVRPSGTEPKIKFYASCRSRAQTPLESAHDEVGAKLQRIQEDIGKLIPQSASSGG